MPRLRTLYCGIVLYFSNSACQAASDKGGMVPVTGFHSTMESPDSVSRVAPPITKVAKIIAATTSSHTRMARMESGIGDVCSIIRVGCTVA
jgi:hypothetical protein